MTPDVIPSPTATSTVLLRYEALVLRSARHGGTVTAREWRECGIALRAAASMVLEPFAAKYLRAATNCAANTADRVAIYGREDA